MSLRLRKLIGGIGMMVFVLVYALVAMGLADSRPMDQAPEWVRDLRGRAYVEMREPPQ